MVTRIRGKIFNKPLDICFKDEIRPIYLGNDERGQMLEVLLDDNSDRLSLTIKDPDFALIREGVCGKNSEIISEGSFKLTNRLDPSTEVEISYQKSNKER